MAVLDGVVLARLRHELCVKRHVQLFSAPVNLYAVKVKPVQRRDISCVINLLFDMLAALAAVQVPCDGTVKPLIRNHKSAELNSENKRQPAPSPPQVASARPCLRCTVLHQNNRIRNRTQTKNKTNISYENDSPTPPTLKTLACLVWCSSRSVTSNEFHFSLPPCFQAHAVDLLHHLASVWERCVDRGNAFCIVLRVIDAGTATFPALVDAHRAVAQVAQRDCG